MSSSINPMPIAWQDTELFVSDYLTESKLKQITRSDDLSGVTMLEMVVDTTETSLGNFGQYMPSLGQLKLSDSRIPGVRDLGTSLRNLRVLWLSRCGLADVDGIASIQSLCELYVSFNDIADASPISFLDSLEVLDLEANAISEREQVDYLCMMSQLSTLTLTGNKVTSLPSKQYGGVSYREYVLARLPALTVLDDQSSKVKKSRRKSVVESESDAAMITAAIKDGLIIDREVAPVLSRRDEETFGSFGVDVLPPSFYENSATERPATSMRMRSVEALHPASPVDGRRSVLDGAAPGSVVGSSAAADDSSALTFGDPHCGNPINLLRSRRRANAGAIDIDDPYVFSRPTTAIGMVSSRDDRRLFDDDVEATPVVETRTTHGLDKQLSIRDLEDEILFSDVEPLEEEAAAEATELVMKQEEARMNFNAEKPPDFLKRLKPPLKSITASVGVCL